MFTQPREVGTITSFTEKETVVQSGTLKLNSNDSLADSTSVLIDGNRLIVLIDHSITSVLTLLSW